MIGVMLGVGFFGIGVIGILAAIAIPAYQDYTIRAQVTEGLNLAATVKADVAEFYAQTSLAEPGRPRRSPGVRQVRGVHRRGSGSVVITYGEAANQKIQGQALVAPPVGRPSGDITGLAATHRPPMG